MDKYQDLIKRIKTRRWIVIISTAVVAFVTIFFCTPSSIVFLDETIVDYKGLNPIITVIIILAIFFLGMIIHALVSLPVVNSLDLEFDPEKHLVLNNALNKKADFDGISAIDYFYLGNYATAHAYACKGLTAKKPEKAVASIFNKARCEYFMNDIAAFKTSVQQHKQAMPSITNPKAITAAKNMDETLDLLCAIADGNKERISALRCVKVWNASRATEGYINLLKGMAAYALEDKHEAIYRFMLVKDTCKKTALAPIAAQYLSCL